MDIVKILGEECTSLKSTTFIYNMGWLEKVFYRRPQSKYFRDRDLAKWLSFRLGHLHLMSDCLGSSLGSTSNSTLLLMCTLGGSR